MSSDRLREAARVLRERAEAATPGPWEGFEQHGRDIADEGWSWIGVKSPSRDVAVTYPTGFEHDEHEADAAYIAMMQPPVALALADWLDAHAATGEAYRGPLPWLYDPEALRLADLILGGTP